MNELGQLREWTGFINTIANGYKKTRILYTAFKGGVFDVLNTERTAVEVAKMLGWSERGTTMLLDGLLAIQLVEKQNGRYRNTPMAQACLAKTGEAYQGDILSHNLSSWDAWTSLEERVRTGTCAPRSEQRTGQALRNFILGMSNIATLSAQEVLEAVDLSRFRHLLDLGGGPGTYSITFLKAHTHLRATLFDHPQVIEIAKEQVETAGLESRMDYISGDCSGDPIGKGYDLVLMSNLIHSFSDEENAALIKKVYEAMTPGGTILIKDFIVDNDRSGPAYSLIFALHMLVHTPGGGTYSFEEIQRWTDCAGFKPGTSIALTPQTRIWIATKPE